MVGPLLLYSIICYPANPPLVLLDCCGEPKVLPPTGLPPKVAPPPNVDPLPNVGLAPNAGLLPKAGDPPNDGPLPNDGNPPKPIIQEFYSKIKNKQTALSSNHNHKSNSFEN